MSEKIKKAIMEEAQEKSCSCWRTFYQVICRIDGDDIDNIFPYKSLEQDGSQGEIGNHKYFNNKRNSKSQVQHTSDLGLWTISWASFCNKIQENTLGTFSYCVPRGFHIVLTTKIGEDLLFAHPVVPTNNQWKFKQIEYDDAYNKFQNRIRLLGKIDAQFYNFS